MLIRRCEPPTSGRRSRRASTPDWAETQLSFTPEGPVAEAAAIARAAAARPCRRRAAAPRPALGRRRRSAPGTSSGGSTGGGSGERSRSSGSSQTRAPTHPLRLSPSTTSLVESWDEALAELPPDWSDLLCELELDSSDHLPRAALLGAPMNPTRVRRCDRAPLPRAPESRATACRRRWRAGASSAWTPSASRGASPSCRSLRHRERRHAGPGLAPRRALRLSRKRTTFAEIGGVRIAYARSSAPKRSARAATMRSRAAVASSSVSVRSGDWNARWIATDLRPAPTCSPR